METSVIENLTSSAPEKQNDLNKTESAENFQTFIYELFEKNGVLGDLRAYLRGHIVNVLKSAQTGDTPACQKYFTQRLEPSYQALNILVAEYLLQMGFGYSLSVFLSEIPLANMVFGLAKSLFDIGSDGEYSGIRFPENDICSVLSYLGVKCDSDHVINICEMYQRNEQYPLLLCILKSVQFHQLPESAGGVPGREESSSEDSELSAKSSDVERGRRRNACKHYATCRSCRARLRRLTDKCARKKKKMEEIVIEPKVNPANVESVVRNISALERNLVNEVFDQMRSVYEGEAELARHEHEQALQRSLAAHAAVYQRKHDELEECFKTRSSELESVVERRKRFLWGLARALRSQHAAVRRAMRALRRHAHALADKEQSLKTQLAEAEEFVEKRGEDMRRQIADELDTLERHLEKMKIEKDNINEEKIQLESTKKSQISLSTKNFESETEIPKTRNVDANDDLLARFDLLKDELAILRNYLESTKSEPKCVIERYTMTDSNEADSKTNVMNNELDGSYKEECARTPNQVVNDFKKQKNVNFCQPRESCAGSGAPRRERDALADENERLRRIAAQQSQYIAAQAQRARPCTAPARFPARGSSAACSCGGGEQAALAQCVAGPLPAQCVARPGDTLPFLGVLPDRRPDSRRHLINQWRALRRRTSPTDALDKRANSPRRVCKERSQTINQEIVSGPSTSTLTSTPGENHIETVLVNQDMESDGIPVASIQTREKSPKQFFREAKENFRSSTALAGERAQSPATGGGGGGGGGASAALRAARRRLRTLQVEADAVERSYRDHRRRALLRQRRHEETEFRSQPKLGDDFVSKGSARLDVREKLEDDLSEYLLRYQKKFDIGQTHFQNKNAASELAEPIPKSYFEIGNRSKSTSKRDYIEKPMTEFRKLYYVQKSDRNSEEIEIQIKPQQTVEISPQPEVSGSEGKERRAQIKKVKNDKIAQLELLKQNISKIYDLQDEPTRENDAPHDNYVEEKDEIEFAKDKNLLRVEVESVSEVNNLKSSSTNQDMLVVVDSSVDFREMPLSAGDKFTTQMTIIVSPKRDEDVDVKSNRSKRSVSPEQAARLTRNDVLDAIFHKDKELFSGADMPQDAASDNTMHDADHVAAAAGDEYLDDFSADVDNYNSNSDIENNINSPISLAKTSEDENFWES